MNFEDLIVIDGLQYSKWTRAYFESLRSAGITAIHATLVYHETARETLSCVIEWNKLFEEHEDIILHVKSVEDIDKAKQTNKLGVFFGAQNCSPIEDDIGLIKVMRDLGLLIMQLTYNNQSLLATGCYEEHDSGLTRFGKQTIKEMNRVGMIIDMSHSAERSTLEAIEVSERPICISHSNPKFAVDALRNKSTTILEALRDNGGFFGFSLYPFHLPNRSDCTLEEFCTLVTDTVNIIGIDNVGIGSDLCLGQPQSILEWMRNGRWSKERNYGEGSASNASWPKPLTWFEDASGMKNIYEGLLLHGFSHEHVKKIIGQNWYDFLNKGIYSI